MSYEGPPYRNVYQDFLSNTSLSNAAFRLVCWLAAQKPGWELREAQARGELGWSADTFDKARAELYRNGYLERRVDPDTKKRLNGRLITEMVYFRRSEPSLEKPGMAKPGMGNPGILTKKIETNESKKPGSREAVNSDNSKDSGNYESVRDSGNLNDLEITPSPVTPDQSEICKFCNTRLTKDDLGYCGDFACQARWIDERDKNSKRDDDAVLAVGNAAKKDLGMVDPWDKPRDTSKDAAHYANGSHGDVASGHFQMTTPETCKRCTPVQTPVAKRVEPGKLPAPEHVVGHKQHQQTGYGFLADCAYCAFYGEAQIRQERTAQNIGIGGSERPQ